MRDETKSQRVKRKKGDPLLITDRLCFVAKMTSLATEVAATNTKPTYVG